VMQSAQPALAVFWGIIILGETVSGAQVVGMALVVVGLGLFTWSSQRAPELPSSDAVEGLVTQ
jgi:drug/metabolite transporter (DMT)-like permease